MKWIILSIVVASACIWWEGKKAGWICNRCQNENRRGDGLCRHCGESEDE